MRNRYTISAVSNATVKSVMEARQVGLLEAQHIIFASRLLRDCSDASSIDDLRRVVSRLITEVTGVE